jgi:hypothetical protein
VKPTIRIAPDDEAGFLRAQRMILAPYEAALREVEPEPDLFVASTMLLYRWGYGDGRILRWTEADIEGYLLDFLPEHASLDPDDARIVPIRVIGFLGYLAASSQIGGDPIDALVDAVDRAEPEFREAVAEQVAEADAGSGGRGPAQRLVAAMTADGVDPTDAEALDRWMTAFNERPEEERSAILGIDERDQADEDEDEVLPVIDVPALDELAEAATESRTFQQLRIVTEFAQEPRRVDRSGALSVGDATLLAGELGLVERPGQMRPEAAARADRLWRWARLVDLVDIDGREAVQGSRAQLLDESPQEAWLLALLALVRGELLDEETDWTPFEEPLIDLLRDLPEQLYRLESLTVPQLELVAERLIESAGELAGPGKGTGSSGKQTRQAKKTDRVARALQTRVLGPLLELGSIVIEDEVVELTPLGSWAVMLWLRARGIDAPVVGDQVELPADEVLAWCGIHTLAEARAELVSWVAARPDSAADELIAALRAGAAVPMGFFALDVVGPEAEPAVRGLLEDERLRSPALLWLVEQGLEDPAALPTEALMGMLVGSTMEILDDEGPEAMVEHLRSQGPEAEQLRLIEGLADVEHPRTTELLQAIGRHHPSKRVASAARAAAFKRLGLQVH